MTMLPPCIDIRSGNVADVEMSDGILKKHDFKK